MYVNAQPEIPIEYGQYAFWLITILLVAFGFQHAHKLIALVLEKLYEVFVQKNSGI